MRITKRIAEEAARRMVAPAIEKMESKKEELKAILRTEYEKNIPEEVVKFAAKYPSYVRKNPRVYIKATGSNQEHFTSLKGLIDKSDGFQRELFIPDDLRVKIGKLQNEIDDLYTNSIVVERNLRKAIEAARTLKKLQEDLPEAIPHIKGTKQEIAINNKDLILDLNKLLK